MKPTHTAIVNFSDKLMKKPRDRYNDYFTKGRRRITERMFNSQGKIIKIVKIVAGDFQWYDKKSGRCYIEKWLKNIKEIK